MRRTPLELVIRRTSKSPRLDELVALARERAVPVREVEAGELERLAGGERHQGVALRVAALPEVALEDLLEAARPDTSPLLLVLDGITDPHNFGAILRNADAAGCLGVVVAKDRACPLTPTVARASAGALEHVSLCQVTNLSRALETMKGKGFWIFGLAGEAEAEILFGADLSGPVALVVGSEGKGLRPNVRRQCDHLLSIPMAGSVSSLNASVAAGVALFEVARQRWLRHEASGER